MENLGIIFHMSLVNLIITLIAVCRDFNLEGEKGKINHEGLKMAINPKSIGKGTDITNRLLKAPRL